MNICVGIDESIEEDEIKEQFIPEKIETQEEQNITSTQELKVDLKEEVKSEVRIETMHRKEKVSPDLEILFSPEIQKSIASSQSFRSYFESRFQAIHQMFAKRRDITNRVSTKDLIPNRNKDKISLIAMVTKVHRTRKD